MRRRWRHQTLASFMPPSPDPPHLKPIVPHRPRWQPADASPGCRRIRFRAIASPYPNKSPETYRRSFVPSSFYIRFRYIGTEAAYQRIMVLRTGNRGMPSTRCPASFRRQIVVYPPLFRGDVYIKPVLDTPEEESGFSAPLTFFALVSVVVAVVPPLGLSLPLLVLLSPLSFAGVVVTATVAVAPSA